MALDQLRKAVNALKARHCRESGNPDLLEVAGFPLPMTTEGSMTFKPA
jgi:hypothetical protein